MVWEILTAIGTLAAVVVALFLPTWQNRRRLSVQVASPSDQRPLKTAFVVVANSGGKVITLVRVLTKAKDGTITERAEEGRTPTLPHTLRPSDFIRLSIPYISENLEEIKEVLVEDSLGKRWNCDAQSRRAALFVQEENRGKSLFGYGKEFIERFGERKPKGK